MGKLVPKPVRDSFFDQKANAASGQTIGGVIPRNMIRRKTMC